MHRLLRVALMMALISWQVPGVNGCAHAGGRTNLTGADAAFQVEGARHCMPWEGCDRYVRQESRGIDVDGMAARRPQNGDPCPHQTLTKEAG